MESMIKNDDDNHETAWLAGLYNCNYHNKCPLAIIVVGVKIWLQGHVVFYS